MPPERKSDKRFPLRKHATGQWCKDIRGRTVYFGVDRDRALARYVAEREALESGRPVVTGSQGDTTVADVLNAFLASRRGRVDSGELTPGTWGQYRKACERVRDCFGRERGVATLTPGDFGRLRGQAAADLGPRALGQFITLVKTVFRWASESDRIAPAKFGPDFKPPARRLVRLVREAKGEKLISAADARKVLESADPQMRAMVLLGLNAGYSPSDCARLNWADLGREPGWIAGSRVKTGQGRRCPLWAETVQALEAVRLVRPSPKSPTDSDAVFLTRMGRRWVRHADKPGKGVSRRDSIGTAFARLAGRCGVKLVGRFGVLRHTFRTIADETLDTVAVRLVMGHADGSIDSQYRERVDDSRLLRVVNHVRDWLLGSIPHDAHRAASHRTPRPETTGAGAGPHPVR